MAVLHVVAIVLTWTSAAAQPAAERTAMLEEAAAIWRAHGVMVVAAAEAASPPTADARLVVTLAHLAAGAARGRAPLGAIAFDHDNLPAGTLTIDAAAVTATIAGLRLGGRPFDQWPPGWRHTLVGRALGRVLAHEIGHYLLASRAHAPDGLMRAAFAADELVRPARSPFAVAARDLPRLEARLAGLRRSESLAENAR